MCEEINDTHVCPYCGKTVKNRYDPRPRYADGSGFDPAYHKCAHCHLWYHEDSDCCPHCDAPYCDGW